MARANPFLASIVNDCPPAGAPRIAKRDKKQAEGCKMQFGGTFNRGSTCP
jgi:hypothetical protein